MVLSSSRGFRNRYLCSYGSASNNSLRNRPEVSNQIYECFYRCFDSEFELSWSKENIHQPNDTSNNRTYRCESDINTCLRCSFRCSRRWIFNDWSAPNDKRHSHLRNRNRQPNRSRLNKSCCPWN